MKREREPQDDLDDFLGEQLQDERFRAAYEDAAARSRLLRNLIRRRNVRGHSQSAVAGLMRTTQSAISDLENGSTDPRLSTLQRYARAVGCQLEIRVKDYPKALRPEYAHEELEIKPVRVIRGDADAHWTIRPVGRTDIRIAVIPHVGIAPVARKDSVAR